MDAHRRKPIELLDAVVDLVEFPQQGKGVERAMGQIKTDIGYDEDLDDLDPIGLRSNSVPHPNRHQPGRTPRAKLMIGGFNNRNITSLNQPRRKMRCGRRASSRSSGTKISAVSKSPLSQFIGICIN